MKSASRSGHVVDVCGAVDVWLKSIHLVVVKLADIGSVLAEGKRAALYILHRRYQREKMRGGDSLCFAADFAAPRATQRARTIYYIMCFRVKQKKFLVPEEILWRQCKMQSKRLLLWGVHRVETWRKWKEIKQWRLTHEHCSLLLTCYNIDDKFSLFVTGFGT